MKANGWTATALIVGLAACGSGKQAGDETKPPAAVTTAASEAAGMTAVANLQTAEGNPAGTATATPGQGALLVSLRVEGLPAGQHGVHVHMAGKCEAPKFEGAGSHWNPGSKQHGLENPQGQHAGDMPNLTVGEDGRGTLTYRLKSGTIEALFDADGSAMVIHAKADDQKTDPSGDSGERIACGVFAPA